jgi:AraC family transcriptional activator of pobA
MGPWIRAHLFHRGTVLPLGRGRISAPRLEALCAELMNEHEIVDTGRVATMGWLTQTLLVHLARESVAIHQSDGRHPSGLFQDFRRLLEDHYAEHWPVRHYAEQLHASESSLNRLCRTVAGTTAFEIVQDRLELEARRKLIFTTDAIHQVAANLGFKDPSYFSRFFRRRTGSSPRSFRRDQQPS